MSSVRIVVAHFGLAIVLVAMGVWHIYLQNKLGAFGFALMLVGSLVIGTKSYKLAKARESQESSSGTSARQPPRSAPDLDELNRLKKMSQDLVREGLVDERIMVEWLAEHHPAYFEQLVEKRGGPWRIKW